VQWNILSTQVIAQLSKIPMVSVFFCSYSYFIAIEITIKAIDNITYQLLTESKKKKNGRSDQYSIQDSEWYKN
jgi:cytochrome c oxidase cbb3-type subunit 3